MSLIHDRPGIEAAAARVREAQATDAAEAERRYRHTVRVREVAGPEVGRAVGDALVGTTTRVRESVHPLGKVQGGAHSHGSVRHSHDRLPGDHLHCPTCGSDTRLCIESGHHEPGAVPAREANAAARSNPWVASMEAVFEGKPAPITAGRALALQWRDEHAGQTRSGQAQTRLGTAWEAALFGGRP